jgi:hypothetical protein
MKDLCIILTKLSPTLTDVFMNFLSISSRMPVYYLHSNFPTPQMIIFSSSIIIFPVLFDAINADEATSKIPYKLPTTIFISFSCTFPYPVHLCHSFPLSPLSVSCRGLAVAALFCNHHAPCANAINLTLCR